MKAEKLFRLCILPASFVLLMHFTISGQSDANTNREATNDPDQTRISGEPRKLEIGIHYTHLFFGTFDPYFTREWRQIAPFPPDVPFIPATSNPKEPGIGARFSYNFSKNVAGEAEVNWFVKREDVVQIPPPNVSAWQGGQKLQILFGPKIGYRNKKIGVFGKVRPGIIHFVEYPVVTFLQQVPPGQPFFSAQQPRRATFFNIDVGGVFEYYPSKRTILRFDAGDTIIRYNAQRPKEINPSFTRHNFQMSLGFGFRF